MKSVLFALAGVMAVVGVAGADMVAAPRSQEAPPPPEPSDMPVQRPVRRPPPPEIPAPPPEVAEHAKSLEGVWQCKGTSSRGDGSSRPMTAALTVKLDLDNAWVQLALVEANTGTVKRTAFRSYDAAARLWTQVVVTNGGAHVLETSTGEANGGWTWTGTSESPQAAISLRDHEEHTADGLKLWGEALLGGSWQRTYEMACTR